MSKGFYQHPLNPSCLCFLDKSEESGITYWISDLKLEPDKGYGWWEWEGRLAIKMAKEELAKRKLGPMELIKWSS